MTHGFTTTKTASGFAWTITETVWSDHLARAVTTIVQSGVRPTRAQAMGAAKRWVLFFRRGGKI